jgi:hypothetical protein
MEDFETKLLLEKELVFATELLKVLQTKFRNSF